VEKNYYLNRSARDGYRSYLQSYASHSLKNIFDVNALDLQKVAKAFGFTVPPSVNVNISASGKTDRSQRRNGAGLKHGGGKHGKEHFIKARNNTNDGRQWK
jgi:ATP-dependent RNA helicase DDX18/HAS1